MEGTCPLRGLGGAGTSLHRAPFANFVSGLKPFQASFDKELANRPERKPVVSDVVSKGYSLRVVLDTSLSTLISPDIAYHISNGNFKGDFE